MAHYKFILFKMKNNKENKNNKVNEEIFNDDQFEETHNIEETDFYKQINKDDGDSNGDILNESEAEKISKIRTNKKKHKKKKKKRNRKSCKNKKNNNNNNDNGYLIKIEESENERQTLEKQETQKETYSTNKKENNYLYNDDHKFSGSYLDYLDIDELPSNLSQKSTNSSEKHVSEHENKKIIGIKRTNSFFNPIQNEFSIFPTLQNEKKRFDISQIIEMEKMIKEYDKNEIENIIENLEEIDVNIIQKFLEDVNIKYIDKISKNYEQNINFNECIYVDTELYNPDKRDFVLLGRKRKRKIKK